MTLSDDQSVLAERARAFLAEHGPATDSALVSHLFRATGPVALANRLLASLRDDARLDRDADGVWRTRSDGGTVHPPLPVRPFVALALATTSARLDRARVVAVSALRVVNGQVDARFSTLVAPQAGRVPRYVSRRLRVNLDAFDAAPDLASVAPSLLAFLADAPVLAQEAATAWAYLCADLARFGQHVSVSPLLLDVNRLAAPLLAPGTKPTLAHIARQIHVPYERLASCDEEATVLARVGHYLLSLQPVATPPSSSWLAPLRTPGVSTHLPDTPGVYVLRDGEQRALYVGKARSLRQRVGAYVARPLGPTRRLEGLADLVVSIETHPCPTEIHALILEAHLIAGLAPRFNTQRRPFAPKLWLRTHWPQPAERRRGIPARPRLLLSGLPADDPTASLGPFRNTQGAAASLVLARTLFGLGPRLYTRDPTAYHASLHDAWQFLNGDVERGMLAARSSLADANARGDFLGARRSDRLLQQVSAYRLEDLLLPDDPLQARYAVLRPCGAQVELCVLDGCILVHHALVRTDAPGPFLADCLPMTAPENRPLVLHWLGAQGRAARVVPLPGDPVAAEMALQHAIESLHPSATPDASD